MLVAAFTLAQILSYPFPAALARNDSGTAIAYALVTRGVRSLWFAREPGFTPVALFASAGDDGQELSDLAISNDGSHVVYVRGGDHDANWPLPLQPNPALSPAQPEMQVWSAATAGGAPKLLGAGDAPVISPDGTRVAFTNDGAAMIAPMDGSAAAKRMFFDRGQDSELQWSPDGTALAFVSARTDHSFIGIYRNDDHAGRVSRADDVARLHAALVARRGAHRVRSAARRRRTAARPAAMGSHAVADLGRRRALRRRVACVEQQRHPARIAAAERRRSVHGVGGRR